jgi:hypothetical protein
MNIRECEVFVNSLILASTEGRELMTPEEAAQSIQEWQAEGWEDIPEGLDGWTLAWLWNRGIRNDKPNAQTFTLTRADVLNILDGIDALRRKYENVPGYAEHDFRVAAAVVADNIGICKGNRADWQAELRAAAGSRYSNLYAEKSF